MIARKCVGTQVNQGPKFKVLIGGVIAFVLMLFLALLDGGRSSLAAAPFAGCPETMFMVRGTAQGNDSTFHTVDVNNNFNLTPGVALTLGSVSLKVNGIGYNIEDGYIYGFQQEPGTSVIRIHSDGSVEDFPNAAVESNAGEVGPNGYLYYSTENVLARVKISTLSDPTPEIKIVPLRQNLRGHGTLDWAYYDNKLWGVPRSGLYARSLVYIDLAQMTWDEPESVYTRVSPDPIYPVGGGNGNPNDYSFGAMFGGTNGLYGNVNSGGFYYFDTTTGLATRLADSPVTASNDGAKCYDSPIRLPTNIGFTKTSYPDVTNAVPTFTPGKTTQYKITVTNHGNIGMVGIELIDPLPAGITTARWQCVEANGAATSSQCSPTSGVGSLDAIVSVGLQTGSSVSYLVDVDVPVGFTGDLVNTAKMILPNTSLQPAEGFVTVTKIPAGLVLEKTGTFIDIDKSNGVTVDDQIQYEFSVSNVGVVTITDIGIVDPMVTVEPASYPSLDPGAPPLKFTATYPITQTDIDNNEIINSATANGKMPDGKDVESPPAVWTFTIPPAPEISTKKSGRFLDDVVQNEFADEGEHIEFSVSVKNSGNISMVAYAPIDAGPTVDGVPLTGNLSSFSPDNQIIPPGEERNFTALYSLTAKDVAEVAGLLDAIQNTVETPVQTLKEFREGKAPELHPLEEPNIMSLPGFAISKKAQVSHTTRGQQVPYVINVRPIDVPGKATLMDITPAGFRYLPGSATVAGLAVEPKIEGRTLVFEIDAPRNEDTRIQYTLVVTGTVNLGSFKNTAQLFQSGQPTKPISAAVSDVVDVVPDPIFDCGDVIGKVFDDINRNGYQDAGEVGIAGARVASLQGVLITTDQYGRFNVACADLPDGRIGSTYIMKLDPRSLPTGYRILSENPRTIRLTAGKISRLNFATSIGRVVRLDLNDAAFLPGQVTLRPEWESKLANLVETLEAEPSILRLSYIDGVTERGLAGKRLAQLRKEVSLRWNKHPNRYRLEIEVRIISSGNVDTILKSDNL